MEESRQYLEDPNEPVPGFEFIEPYVKVRGANYRLDDIIHFSKKRVVWLELVREPENQYDKNAIKLIGHYDGNTWLPFSERSYHLGYVPKEIAEELVKKDLVEHCAARVRRVYIPDSEDEATIVFQLFVETKYAGIYNSNYDSHGDY